jgi:hypothetical protein
MKTKIIKIKGDWQEVVNDCRTTVGKDELGKEPSAKFKREILISEHSPIRSMSVKWQWNPIPSWVATHFARHKFEKFIKTQRSDRTGVDRNKLPQDAPVIMTCEANTQHLIDCARKRLCMLASSETRKHMEDLKTAIHLVEPEISDVLVPNCVYRCGCPEPNGCSWYEAICVLEPKLSSTDIQERYDAYNTLFHVGGDNHAKS